MSVPKRIVDLGITVNSTIGQASSNISPSPSGPYTFGGKIILSSDEPGDYQLYLLNENVDNRSRLLTSINTDEYPIFRPDGQYILFQKYNGSNYENYSIKLDGLELTRMTNNADITPDLPNSNRVCPSFDNTGTKMFFAAFTDGYGVCYDGIIGSTPYEANKQFAIRVIGNVNSRLDSFPFINPTDNNQAIWCYYPLSLGFTNSQINAVNLTTLGVTNIITFPEYGPGANDITILWKARYSPDATKIALSKKFPDNDYFHVFIFELSDPLNTLQAITSGSANYKFQAWSPDGTKLLISSDVTGKYQNYIMNASPGALMINISNNEFNDNDSDWVA